MGRVREPLERVAHVRTRKEANFLRGELRWSLENENVPAAWEHEAEEALSLLDEHFPPRRARSTDPASEPLRTEESDDGEAAPSAAPTRSRARHGSRRRRATHAGGRADDGIRTRTARAARGAAREVAEPITSTGTDVMLGAARAGLALALLYLILSNRGSKGLSGILHALSAVVAGFFDPHVDPLAGLASGAAAHAVPGPATAQTSRGASLRTPSISDATARRMLAQARPLTRTPPRSR